MYLKGIKDLFDDQTMHIEAARGSDAENFTYCTKEGEWFELGTRKTCGKGIQENCQAKIQEFLTMDRADFIEQNIAFHSKYNKSLNQLELLKKAPKELKERNIRVAWGVAGSGKTHSVFERYKLTEIYSYTSASTGVWFDGYDPMVHTTLLLDEFVGYMPLHFFLRLLDKYPVMGDVKGGRVNLLFENIEICSNRHPSEWYPNASYEQQQAIMRRIIGKTIHYAEAVKKDEVKLDWGQF